jgi:protein-S-isoprenylcysteine O-methyltransferase Ste14
MKDSRVPALGSRGEGWVVAQFVLLAGVVVLGVIGDNWARSLLWPLIAVGIGVGALGWVVMVKGARRLGPSLTPLPKPMARGSLEESGIYAKIRHPIYSGAILLGLGWSLATSPLALGGALVLALFFDVKSHREEVWLHQHYDGYGEYRSRVRWKFIPGVR